MSTPVTVPIKRALVSVYDKAGLEDLARGLHAAGVELVSTGKSAAVIRGLGIPVTEVAELTGFPECLDGRVKTLHPKVHAGLLADRRLPEHVKQLEELRIEPFDLVVSNLYPFTQTVASGAAPDECVEQIDIGGPSMVRAAAKNHASVAVVTDPERYPASSRPRRPRASPWRSASAWRPRRSPTPPPTTPPSPPGSPAPTPRTASRRSRTSWPAPGSAAPSCATARTRTRPPRSTPTRPARWLAGRAAARQGDVVQQLRRRRRRDPLRVRLRRARRRRSSSTPTRAASRSPRRHRRGAPPGPRLRPGLGVRRRHRGQPHRHPWRWRARSRRSSPRSSAPRTSSRRRWRRSRPRRTSGSCGASSHAGAATEFRQISGGVLLQNGDRFEPRRRPGDWTLATGDPADEATCADLVFAWRALRAVKSNAILLATGGASVGVGHGPGQPGRLRAPGGQPGRRPGPRLGRGLRRLLPVRRRPEVLIDAGVKAIVQPGGSVRDELTIAAARDGRESPCTSPGPGTSPTRHPTRRSGTQMTETVVPRRSGI